MANTAIAIVGPPSAEIEDLAKSGAAKRGFFREWENESIDGLLRAWRRSRGEPEDEPKDEAPAKTEQPAETSTTGEGQETMPGALEEDVSME